MVIEICEFEILNQDLSSFNVLKAIDRILIFFAMVVGFVILLCDLCCISVD